ncbi:uncharacterized protein LOC114358832 [Ostrinia furnacalis]|uniref:uncharacterized protein LOC114358832 n=1 Tax=Ostrinia furnacalis TaxID=93504 RepID=UPI00103B40C1|nr:uncharacterized protein LOC114358832 [Ostrinia furnacalis]
MRDDYEYNNQLIQMIQERPCLFDYNRPDYRNRNVQDAAWLEISNKMNESVADCKERWKNIRGCYTRHLKNRNRASGSSSKSKYVKPYYLAEQLQFLDGFTKTRPPKGFFYAEPRAEMDQEDLEMEEDSDNSCDAETPSPIPSPVHKKAVKRESEMFSKPNDVKKPKKVSLNDVNTFAVEYFKSKQKMTEHSEHRDPDFAFLYSLLPDMKDMTREQKRKFKMGVLQLVGDVLEDNT